MLYLAYGSNLLTKRMERRVAGATLLNTVKLNGWKLVYNKKSTDGSVKANIMQTNNSQDFVLTAMYYVPRAAKLALDAVEGKSKGYTIKRLNVGMESVVAFTYVATNTESNNMPYSWYTAIIKAGMEEQQYSASYIAKHTTNIATKIDSNKRRALLNTSTLTGSSSATINKYTAAMYVRKYIVKAKYFSLDVENKHVVLTALNTTLCNLFNITTTLEFGAERNTCTKQIIKLKNESVVSYLVMFASALNTKDDNVSWAHTIYFISSVEMYLKAVANNLIASDITLLGPFANNNAKNAVAITALKNKFYKHFKRFIKQVKFNSVSFTAQDLQYIATQHSSLTQHVNNILA